MKKLLLAMILVLAAVHAGEARSLRIGDMVPGFQLRNGAGELVDTGRLKGKVVVIYFWNDRCGCREQLVELKPFIAGLKGKPFALITVNEGQGQDLVAAFLRDNRLAYVVLLDPDLAIGKKTFAIRVLPTIFVIGKDGTLREKLIGVVDSKRLETIIKRHL